MDSAGGAAPASTTHSPAQASSSLSSSSSSRSKKKASSANARLGDALHSRAEKVNGDLFVLTYGALVAQLVEDYEDPAEVNAQLEKMGRGIGVRIIDEFLAKSGVRHCGNFAETADIVANVGFKMFLGVSVDVVGWNAEGTKCSLVFKDNPLEDFVELPPALGALSYSNLLCGVIAGALNQVNVQVKCTFEKDALKGDECTIIGLQLQEYLQDAAGEEYRDD